MVVHPYAPDLVIDVDAASGADLVRGRCTASWRWRCRGSAVGQRPHPTQYGVDESKTHLILLVARVALQRPPAAGDLPGHQIVNVALGGDLVQDMDDTVGNHRNRVHDLDVAETLAVIVEGRTAISCYHHQCIATLEPASLRRRTRPTEVIEAVTCKIMQAGISASNGTAKISAATDPVQAECSVISLPPRRCMPPSRRTRRAPRLSSDCSASPVAHCGAGFGSSSVTIDRGCCQLSQAPWRQPGYHFGLGGVEHR